jgi:hypothetical protein
MFRNTPTPANNVHSFTSPMVKRKTKYLFAEYLQTWKKLGRALFANCLPIMFIFEVQSLLGYTAV